MNKAFNIKPFLCFMALGMGLEAHAQENDGFPELKVHGLIDLRAVRTSGETSWLDKGLGKTRYGATPHGNSETDLRLADAALILEPKFSWDLTGLVHLQFLPEQTKDIDVVEAFIKYSSLALSETRYSGKLGLFFPPISLEHTDIGWTSPYTLTPSAINSWVGEEVKALTLEATMEKRLEDDTISITLATFMKNDTTTSLFAWRGWALHDQKASLQQRFPLPPIKSLSPGGIFHPRQAQWTEPHSELDNKPGYYVGVKWDHLGFLSAEALYYNNRGNPATHEGLQYAWDVDFISLGATYAPNDNIELLSQYMTGTSLMGPLFGGENATDTSFTSFYLLASYLSGDHRLSARYDYFKQVDNNQNPVLYDDSDENGQAFTMAYSYFLTEGHRLMAEWLHVRSERDNRLDLGLAREAIEDQFQISYRVSF